MTGGFGPTIISHGWLMCNGKWRCMKALLSLNGGLDVGDKVVIAQTDSTFKTEFAYRAKINEMREFYGIIYF